MSVPLLSIKNLHIQLATYAGDVHAVNGMNFDIHSGEMFGLVGETGCGKTVTGLSIMHAVPPPGVIVEGQIFFQGKNILDKSETEMQ